MYGLAARCGCLQHLRQRGLIVQDASGCLHASEMCLHMGDNTPSPPDGSGHSGAITYVELCEWCLFERLEEVDPQDPPQ